MQIIGSWFTMSYWSITLVEPLKRLFDERIIQIGDDRSKQEQDNFEYKLYLICSVLASEDFVSFEQYRKLVEQYKSQDLSLFAVLMTHYRNTQRYLPDEYKNDENLQWAGKKLLRREQSLGDIAPYVNTPVNKLLAQSSDKANV